MGSGTDNVGLQAALNDVKDAFRRGQQACDELSGAAASMPTTAALSYTEACHIVQRRDDEKRKRESKHDAKNKKKGGQEQLYLPGSQPGVDPDVSAFWMVMEVRLTASTATMSLRTR